MKRAVDGNNITLSQHLLQISNTTATNLLLNLRLKWLVIEVQKLLAVERLETPQDTLTDTTDSDGTHNLALQIELVLSSSGDVPFSGLDLLVCGDKVADEDEDGHNDVLCNRDDVGASDFSDGNTAIGGIGSIQVDVIGSNTSSDGELEVLSLGQSLSSEVTWVETVPVNGCMREIECAAYGVVMMISASTNSWSNFEFSPSLSDVVTKVCP